MKRVAIPVWDKMISPVLDTARKICVYRIEDSKITSCEEHLLPEDVYEKAKHIRARADFLICGALSCKLEQDLSARGVVVHPWIMGESDIIANAYAHGKINKKEYSMPGCRRQHHRRCGRSKKPKEFDSQIRTPYERNAQFLKRGKR